jgi:NADPH:quinone reductase-like Zn-dependent oxidoreductase
MNAAVRYQYGDASNISMVSVDRPSPAKGEVLVKVHYTTVNRTDCGVALGWPFVMRFFTGLFKPTNPVIGTDFAGEIVELGEGVSNFKLQDRVFGFKDEGLQSQAEYLVIKSDYNISTIPNEIDYKTAAASLEAAHYAINFMNKVDIKDGQRILLNGATGGIGSAVLQFLKMKDVHITAVCNTKNISLIKSLGADKIYDYQKEDFTQSGEIFDHVIDAVGKSTFGKCKPLLLKGGTYTSSELGPYWQNIFYALYTPLFSSKKVKFPLPNNIQKSIAIIKERLAEGTFVPVVDKVYDLKDVRSAYEFVNSGQKTGNVLLKM